MSNATKTTKKTGVPGPRCLHNGRGCGRFDGTQWVIFWQTGHNRLNGMPLGKAMRVCSGHASSGHNTFTRVARMPLSKEAR